MLRNNMQDIVKCMYILSLLYGLSIHNSFGSWPNVFTFSTVVVDKGTVRLPKYYVINAFKLEYLRYLLSDLDQTCFGKKKTRMTMPFNS